MDGERTPGEQPPIRVARLWRTSRRPIRPEATIGVMSAPHDDEQDSPDTIERFVYDLRGLYLGTTDRPTFKQLARLTHRSSSSLHAAVTYADRLPSQTTVRALIQALDPAHLDDWQQRRNSLDPRAMQGGTPTPQTPSTLESPLPQPGEMLPTAAVASTGTRPTVSTTRRAVIIAGVLALIAGWILATPFDLGGVNTVAFCGGNHPRKDGLSGQRVTDGTWLAWHCELDDGTYVPVDMQLACHQQYPASGPFGGAQYAGHRDQGLASWRCYGSVIHTW